MLHMKTTKHLLSQVCSTAEALYHAVVAELAGNGCGPLTNEEAGSSSGEEGASPSAACRVAHARNGCAVLAAAMALPQHLQIVSFAVPNALHFHYPGVHYSSWYG